MKFDLNALALGVAGIVCLAGIGAVVAGAELSAVMAIGGPVIGGCLALAQRSGQ